MFVLIGDKTDELGPVTTTQINSAQEIQLKYRNWTPVRLALEKHIDYIKSSQMEALELFRFTIPEEYRSLLEDKANENKLNLSVCDIVDDERSDPNLDPEQSMKSKNSIIGKSCQMLPEEDQRANEKLISTE